MKTKDNNVSTQRTEVCRTEVSTRLASEADATAWDKFVDFSPKATVFHRWAWRAIVEKIHGHKAYFLIAQKGLEIVGILPLAHNKTLLFGNTLVSLPFCPYGGPIALNSDIETALNEEALALSKRIGADHLEIRLLKLIESPLIANQSIPTQEIYVTFRKQLLPDHEENMLQIPRKQRAMIRKGIKNGLTSTIENVEAFYPLYCDNIHRHGTPGSPKSFFLAIEKAFGLDCEVLIVRDTAGQALSGVLSLFYKNEVLPFYAGDIHAARDVAANDFKYAEVMRRAIARGASVFDFGRSKKGTGPYNFKCYWGFEPTPLRYEHHGLIGAIPEHNPLNPKFQMLIATWRRLPRSLVNWLGPKVVKGLG